MPTSREKILLPMLAVAAGGYASDVRAQTYQTFNVTPTAFFPGTGSYSVNIGGSSVAQYTYSYTAPTDPGPKPPKSKTEIGPRTYTFASAISGTEFVDSVRQSAAAFPPPGQPTGNTTGPLAASPGDGFYFLRFEINGAQQTGYAQFSPDNSILRGVGYMPAAPLPEPATWLEMILGFGVVGAASRRARRPRRADQFVNA